MYYTQAFLFEISIFEKIDTMADFNQLCDELLSYYAAQTGIAPVEIAKVKMAADPRMFDMALDRLLADNYVANLSAQLPASHAALGNRVHVITGHGYAFIFDGGYQSMHRRILKERQKLQLDTFKLGWEMVISFLALGVSIWALIAANS
ncbi:hypothetical protein [Sphingobacterium multivorum]|uniref:hypothetical protein n=1 Tax=Sphingobacterium multivorum TaxID=28454 RepID=UPI003DA262F2